MGGNKSEDPTQPQNLWTMKKWKQLLSFLSLPILLHQFSTTSFCPLVILANTLATLLSLFSFSTLSKPNSRLYDLWCILLSLIAPLIVILVTEEFLYFFLGSILLCPILLLFLTGNQPYCLFSSLIQLLIVNFPLKELLWRTVRETNGEVFVTKILEALTIQLLQLIVIICCSEYTTLEHTCRQAQKLKYYTELVKQAHKKYINSFSFEIKDALNCLQVSIQAASLREMTSSSDKEMLKIAKISSETIHRLFSNMTQLFELESDNSGTILNYTYSLSFLEITWEVALSYIQRKRQEGALKILNEIPNNIKLDIHRTKHLIVNLVEFLLHNNESKRVDVHVEWLDLDLDALLKSFKPNSRDLFGKALSEYSAFSKDLSTDNTKKTFPSKTPEKGGFLKIIIIGTGFSLKEDDLRSTFDKVCTMSKDIPKSTSELGLCAVKKICIILKSILMLMAHEYSTSLNIYIPSWHEVKDEVIC